MNRTRRIASSIAAVSLTGVALTACSSSDDSSSNTTGGVSAGSTLTIGSDLTYPPYAYLDGDTPAGFDPDLWKILGPELGVDYTFKDTRFEQLIPGLNSTHFDLISSALYITSERAEQVDFIPYFSTGNAIISRADSDTKPATIEELCGLKVAVLKGSDISNKLSTDGAEVCAEAGKDPINVNDFPTDPEATQALLAGQADVEVTDTAVASNIVSMQDALEVTSSELLYPVPVSMAVAKGNDELKKTLEDGLEALKENGSYQELLNSYGLTEPTQAQLDEALGN